MRYNVATQLVDICEAMGPEVTRAELAPAFIRLLRDPEAEVRVAAAGKVGAVSKLLAPAQLVPSIMPCVTDLSMDSSQFVRTALAGVVMELAPLLGKQATIGEPPMGQQPGRLPLSPLLSSAPLIPVFSPPLFLAPFAFCPQSTWCRCS